jgi:hypothetical protein
VGDIVGAFKSITTNQYIRGVRDYGWPAFEKRLWQRNYWERIIRNERELDRISKVYLEQSGELGRGSIESRIYEIKKMDCVGVDLRVHPE